MKWNYKEPTRNDVKWAWKLYNAFNEMKAQNVILNEKSRIRMQLLKMVFVD